MVDIGSYDYWGELLLTEVNSVSQRAYTGLTPARLRMERGVVCEVTPTALLSRFLGSSFSHEGYFFLSQNSQI